MGRDGDTQQLPPGFPEFALDNFADAVYFVRQDASIAYVNQAASDMLGYSHEELMNMRITDLNPTIPASAWPKVWEMLQKEKKRTFESAHTAKDGRVVPTEVSANLLLYKGQEFSCAFVRDISDRKAMEARLRHAEKMEAIGRLAGGIAHDFNNQLAGIQGHTDLLRQDVQSDTEAAANVERIATAVARASGLTRQLLAYSRKGKYQVEPTDLHDLVREVSDVLEHTIDKKIAISIELSAAQHIVDGDIAQLENAILNLGLNARDAMPDGGKLEFTTHNITIPPTRKPEGLSEGPHIQLTVTDTGHGMDAETLARVFEPFFTTKEGNRGTGLGLAAAYGTAKNHGGALSAKSVLNHGSVLTLTLPLSREQNISKTTPSASPNARAIGANVLVVEDEAVLRPMIERLLKSLGCTCTLAANGRDAVKRFQESETPFDLVVLDMLMPEMNGREAFAELKKIDPKVRVLVATGYGLDGDMQSMLDNGAAGFLQKPFTLEDLSQAITEAVKR